MKTRNVVFICVTATILNSYIALASWGYLRYSFLAQPDPSKTNLLFELKAP